MDVKNNPAGRLHDILLSARQQQSKEPARKAWATVFQIEPNDTSSLLKLLADLINLVHETKTAIQRLEDVDHALHLKPFKRIESLLSQLSLDSAWDHWKAQIDDSTLYGLQFSADRLSRISGFTQIPNDELKDIRNAIDEIFNKVFDSSIPAELRALLLRNIEAIRLAFVSYRIRGIEGIQGEIERSVGSILLHQDAIKRSNPDDHGLWKTFFGLIDRLNKVVTLARNTKEIAPPIVQAITQLL
ncbi:hypothetical protein DFR24_0376 [Panacagrimonas perspica]|uniref:Uncharacterized protein n=1 Tax=Panacagrimonas perspica TaxID=381431 RepID=A0A4R7PAQ4_9GAMM|nr:hypothetical protein [Panacagrimonas perspica]TDU31018.1 hypothetical protein DFR24_0376 [Panacagrimonas perspica]